MKTRHFLGAIAVCAMVAPARLHAQADIPADYLSIIGNTAATECDLGGWVGSVPVYGRASFPVLADDNDVPVLAAGRYQDGVNANAARAVAAAQNGFFNTDGVSTCSRIFENSVLWASRQNAPGNVTVASTDSAIRNFFSTRGYLTKAITTTMSNAATDLSGCTVFVGDFHSGFSADAIAKINAFTAAGGGIVVSATSWHLPASDLVNARSVLDPFGLTFSTVNLGRAFQVRAVNFPIYHSAKIGLDQIVADAQGGPVMTPAAKQSASAAVARVLAVSPAQADLVAGLETLHNIRGWIAPTLASPLVVANSPVEAMLVRYHQSGKLDALAPGDQFVHPVASDIPGLPTPGAARVTRSVTINGNTTPSNYPYMYHASRPTRVETGLYAGPGEVVTITLPADKTGAGLKVHIGCTEDTLFSRPTWNSYPKLWRRQDLPALHNEVGHAIGGLITILVPPGSNLGDFDITIANALPAPCFTLGSDTNADWNDTLKNNPAPWGYVQTPKVTFYVRRSQLAAVSDMEAVANHWHAVMSLGDEYFGNGPFRQRAEVMTTNRQTQFGGAYAGYPIENGWGVDEEKMLGSAVANGHWGSYHELGHTYQAAFGSHTNRGLSTHGEIDVNLFPGLIYTLIHDRTAWDNNSHPTFNAADRTFDRAQWLTRPANLKTWLDACQNDKDKPNGTYVAYDFHFNLAEGFGYAAYRTAFTRLQNWWQNQRNPALGAPDAELSALNAADPNVSRNRFYLLMCDATGRNLDQYFQFYGLGVVGGGYEITQSVKNAVVAKGYPVWTGNQPLTALANPGDVNVPENTAAGTVIATLTATDPEPGTIFTYSITGGNGSGLFTINKRTGAISMTAASPDFELGAAAHNLTVRCQDNGLPRYERSESFAVNVTNVIEAPWSFGFSPLAASSTMAAGTLLGQVVKVDSARVLATADIVSGNASGAFSVNAAGQLVLANPAALPATSLLTLVIAATDSGGLTGHIPVRVIVNATAGLHEQRWAGANNYNTNTWSGATNHTGTLASATTGQNAADNYSRRVTGWLVAPASGSYTFWISSDDDSRFYLGADASDGSKVQRASVAGYTGFQSFTGQASQKSAVIGLEAGKAYWFEAQQLEGGGGDHLSIAWQGPGIATRTVIPGAHLIPAQPGIAVQTQLPRPPTFVATPLVKAGAGALQPYAGSLAADAFDPDAGDVLTFAKVSGPAWLHVAADGTLSGTPAIADAGNNSFTVRVTDSTHAAVTAALEILVTAPDPAADPDGDGFTTGLELALGSDPGSAASQPAAHYANLRAWWRFDESSGTAADDTTGRPQDGAVTGATWTAGISGNALSFSGASHGVLMGTAPAMTGTGDFTVSAWVKVEPGSSGGAVIQQREPGGTGYHGQYALNVNPTGTVNFYVYGTSAHQFNLTTAATINDGEWHLIAGTRQGVNGAILVDGMPAAAGSSSATLMPLISHAVSVGYDNRDLTQRRFNGRIDEVKIHERILSAAELKVTRDALVPNSAPVFTAASLNASATEDTAFAGQLAATDADFGDTRTYSKLSGPAWLQVAADGALSGTPGNGDVGANNFSVRVSDAAGLVDEEALTISVSGVNDAPTIANVADQSTNEDTATSALPFVIGDIDTVVGSLTVTRSSSDTTLVPLANVVLGGSGANRTVTITPAANQSGTATITLTVNDGALTASETFVLTVTAVNDAPTLANVADQSTNEDTATSVIPFVIGDIDTAVGSLTVTRNSSNPSLVPLANVVLGGSGANRTVTITPAANQSGTATITLTVNDGVLTTSDTFALTVTAVNDAPVLDLDELAALQASGGEAISGEGYEESAANIASDPEGDTLTFTKSSGPSWLVVGSTGILSGTPPAADEGTTAVTIRATDPGGAWAEATFDLTVIVRRSLAVNFSNSTTAATAVLATENTNALNTAAAINGPVVWSNQAINDAGNGTLADGRGTGTYSGVTVNSFSSVPWQQGSSALSGSDASQRVFHYYLDDAEGGGGYFNGDSVGASIHLTGLGQFLAANRATNYTLTLLFNSDTTSAAPFLSATVRNGVPSAPSATAIPNLASLGTIVPQLLGDGKQPLPGVGTSTTGKRGWGRLTGLTADSITISLPPRAGTTRGAVAGFILTPVNGPLAIGQDGYLAWTGTHFGGQSGDPETAGEFADPNHDGLVNLLAYAMGIDPLAPPAAGATPAERGVIELVQEAGVFRFDYQRDVTATAVSLVIEQSADLADPGTWEPAAVTEEILSEEDGIRTIRATFTPEPGQARCFFRLHASR